MQIQMACPGPGVEDHGWVYTGVGSAVAAAVAAAAAS